MRREHARLYERKRFETVQVDELVGSESPELGVAEDQEVLDVRRAIFALDDDYREPLVMQVLLGHSTEEIATELGLTRGRGADAAVPGAAETATDAGTGGERGVMAMDCVEFRREAGADPRHLGAEAAAHRDACATCAESLRRMLALDERILAALRVPVPAATGAGRIGGTQPPDDRAARVIRFPVIERRRWIALAASIVGGVVVGSLLWVGGPRPSLAEDVVKHVEHEPGAMVATSRRGRSRRGRGRAPAGRRPHCSPGSGR